MLRPKLELLIGQALSAPAASKRPEGRLGDFHRRGVARLDAVHAAVGHRQERFDEMDSPGSGPGQALVKLGMTENG
jgi:hypothetical protein